MLDNRTAAAYINVTPGSLRNLRSKGQGPKFTKAKDGRCYYTVADLDAYLKNNPRRAASVERSRAAATAPGRLAEALAAAGVAAVFLHGDRESGKTWAEVPSREAAR